MTVRSVRSCRLRPALVALLPVLTTGCYTLVAVRPGDALVGRDVRAELSDPARQRLWAVVPRERRYLEGQLIRQEGDTLLLEVSIRGPAGQEDDTFIQRIPVTRDEVLFLQTRQLDRFRTFVTGGLFAAATASLVVSIFTGKAGGGDYPPPPDTGPGESVISGLLLPGR